MKLYLDKNKRIIAYETTFFDVKKEKHPKTDFIHPEKQEVVFLTPEQNRVLQRYMQKGGKVTDLIFDKEFKEDKLERPTAVCGLDLQETVIVRVQNFTPNSDLKRHLKNENYKFRELKNIPIDDIKEEYLYDSDKNLLQIEHEKRLNIGSNKRYFGLFDKNNLIAFVFLLTLYEFPRVAVLYHDESYDNGGYIIVDNLIRLLKEEKVNYLDLGGLTLKESGINQFKKKWGETIRTRNISQFYSKIDKKVV